MQEQRNTAVEPESEREHTILREFDVPARILFEACSHPEHVKRWFGPKGYPLTKCEMDFRVGGSFRFQMTGPDGEKGPLFGGEYLAIEPGRRIQFTNGFLLPGEERMLVTWTFEERGGRTLFRHHTVFGSIAMKKSHLGLGFDAGVNSGLDQLVEVVAKLAAR